MDLWIKSYDEFIDFYPTPLDSDPTPRLHGQWWGELPKNVIGHVFWTLASISELLF